MTFVNRMKMKLMLSLATLLVGHFAHAQQSVEVGAPSNTADSVPAASVPLFHSISNYGYTHTNCSKLVASFNSGNNGFSPEQIKAFYDSLVAAASTDSNMFEVACVDARAAEIVVKNNSSYLKMPITLVRLNADEAPTDSTLSLYIKVSFASERQIALFLQIIHNAEMLLVRQYMTNPGRFVISTGTDDNNERIVYIQDPTEVFLFSGTTFISSERAAVADASNGQFVANLGEVMQKVVEIDLDAIANDILQVRYDLDKTSAERKASSLITLARTNPALSTLLSKAGAPAMPAAPELKTIAYPKDLLEQASRGNSADPAKAADAKAGEAKK